MTMADSPPPSLAETPNELHADEDSTIDDATLILKAEAEAEEERLLNAARLLKQVKDPAQYLTPKHYEIIRWADATEVGMKVLLQSPESESSDWIKQSESHGSHNFFVYYQVDKDTNQLFCRIESAIEHSLLLPIISVFNESDLYKEWMPSWKRPFKLGYRETKMLKESGRGNQLIQVVVDMPIGFATREVIFHAVAVDVIEEESAIAIKVMTETPADDPIIPEPAPGVLRIEFENSMLIRGCPISHACYPKDAKEEVFLISLNMSVNARVGLVPQRMINFVTRTVIGRLWAKLLHVADNIRSGEMPSHLEAMERKRELYDWIEARLKVMIEKVKEQSKHNTTSAS